MTTGVQDQPQTSFDEAPLEDKALADLLEKRHEAREKLKPVRKAYNTVHASAKEHVENLGLPDGTYRCGRFVVSIKEAEEKHIEFERASNKRVVFSVAKT
jgi:hypothetical protein